MNNNPEKYEKKLILNNILGKSSFSINPKRKFT